MCTRHNPGMLPKSPRIVVTSRAGSDERPCNTEDGLALSETQEQPAAPFSLVVIRFLRSIPRKSLMARLLDMDARIGDEVIIEVARAERRQLSTWRVMN